MIIYFAFEKGRAMCMYVSKIFIDITELFVFILAVYYLCTAFFSLFDTEKNPKTKKEYRYVAVIPAHNEESCIQGLLKSIAAAKYPSKLIKTLVVADGCTDATEAVARKNGADVLVRSCSETKGEALKEAFEFVKCHYDYDAVVVFDADNIVDESFFAEIGDVLAAGSGVVQGYVDSKNPRASWVSYAYSVWYWIYNRVSQAGRSGLNFGCRLCGTGFAIRKDILDKVGWNTVTSAEDCEYTCILAENDIKVKFCERAVVYDEKPVDFGQSVKQRVRWMQGICDVQGEYTLKFLKKLKINSLLGLWGDFLSTFCFVFLLTSFFMKIGNIWRTTAGAVILWVYISMYLLTALLAVLKDRKISAKMILNIFGYVVYIVSWIPICALGIFGKREWYHTKHDGMG